MYSVTFLKKGQYVQDASRWLKKGRYEDIDMPEEEGEHLPESDRPDRSRAAALEEKDCSRL